MDQHPQDPRPPVSPAPRKRLAGRRFAAVAALLAVAAGTVGTGVYLNRDSPTWQRILGTEPVVEVVPTAVDELPVRLGEIDAMLRSPDPSTDAKTTTALGGVRELLAEHVELLTPGALAALQATAQQTAADGSEAPAEVLPPPAPAEFATRLAQAGNGLLDQSLGAPGPEARRLSGAGIELVLASRTLLSATGAKQADLDKLPTPDTALAAATPQATAGATPSSSEAATPSRSPDSGPTSDASARMSMPDFVFASCPAPGTGTATATASESGAKAGQDASADSGTLLGQVVDASYRLGYAYDVAGARTSAGVRTTAWERSTLLVDFASSIEQQLDAALDCEPLRQPAYQLPDDAIANPMDAARSGEGQLALLLRDAAAAQTGEARAYLLNAAWTQALTTRQVTGETPDFTRIESAANSSAVAR